MKYLIVEMSDKTQWAIPAMIIAEDKAKYYANHDAEAGYGEYDDIYKEEIIEAMSDEYEITDWAANNMDWEDVCSHAIQLKVIPPKDYHRDWINAPKSVREMEEI